MHVFVVEDEKKIASFIEKELVAQGFTTDVCENGDDALAVIRTRSFDVIILDIMLPGSGWFEYSSPYAGGGKPDPGDSNHRAW